MRCRLCGNTDTPTILQLGKMPLANAFLDNPNDPEELFNLELVFCPNCALVQITETIPPSKLFSNYLYFSSISKTMLEHVRDLAESLIAERKLNERSQVTELASNDGYALQYFKRHGVPVLGVDPAVNVAKVAQDKGIPTICDFFSEKLAETLPKADVVLALNVLGHVDDLSGFVDGIRKILKPNGVAVIEVPYVRNLVESCEVDTIYFEHLSYFSLTALDNLFKWLGLEIVGAEEMDIHGGSLRLYVTRPNPLASSDRYGLATLYRVEQQLGVDRLPYYQNFRREVAGKLDGFRSAMQQFKSESKHIIAYGAAAKGVQLLNMAGVGSDVIDYVVDATPSKQGKYLPGSHVKVVPPSQFGNPDVVVLLAWNWKQEIQRQHPDFNGTWFVPGETNA